ncbi:MAG TPA: hypothetical protein VID19_04350 [Candidatus Eremiobacteraceae bacterium]|jgi:hypothetical protein
MTKKPVEHAAKGEAAAKPSAEPNIESLFEGSGHQSVDEALKFVLTRPMATPREMGAAFDQFIAAAADLAGCTVRSRITPGLSGVTISWDKSTVPSREWLRGLEEEIVAFGACSGLQVWFRRH